MLLDKDIREALFDYLELEYKKARFYEEKMIGKSRADVYMVIDGALVGIEIKSDADTYTRLAGQIKDYDRYFDYNLVVVGSSHAMHVEEHVPDYWGIITVDEFEGKPDFYFLRRPEPNKKVNINKKLELLWRPELAVIQEKHEMAKYAWKSKPFVREKILEKVSAGELNYDISELLFERDYEKLLAEIDEHRKERNPRRRGPKKSTKVRRVRKQAKN